MMKIFNYILAGMIVCMMIACEKEKVPLYENNPGVFFYRSSYTAEPNYQRDSVSVSFFAKQVETGEKYSQYLDVRTVGFPAQTARPVRLVQTNAGEPGAAEAGKHYVAFTESEAADDLIMPAGATGNLLYIHLINTPDLLEKEVRLELEIQTNEYFNAAIPAQSKYVISFTGQLTRPQTWQDREAADWFAYFGKWSKVKMKYISDVTGITDFDYTYFNPPLDLRYYSRKVYSRWAQEYSEQNPLLDENNNVVTFPSTYVQ